MSLRIRAALHEIRCIECRVTWRSWLARLLGVGGMEPKVCTCARPLAVGESMRPCTIHGWTSPPAPLNSETGDN